MRSVKYLGGLAKTQALQGRGTDPVKFQGLATAVLTCSGKVQNFPSKEQVIVSCISYQDNEDPTPGN